MKKTAIIIGLLVLALLISAYFVLSLSKKSADEFDPSAYFEGESVDQGDVEKVLTKEEREEIDRIFNEQTQ